MRTRRYNKRMSPLQWHDLYDQCYLTKKYVDIKSNSCICTFKCYLHLNKHYIFLCLTACCFKEPLCGVNILDTLYMKPVNGCIEIGESTLGINTRVIKLWERKGLLNTLELWVVMKWVYFLKDSLTKELWEAIDGIL